jgi:hypothetical protein
VRGALIVSGPEPRASLRLVLAFSVVTGCGVPRQVFAAEDFAGGWAMLTISDAFQTDTGPSRWRYSIDAQARYFDIGSGVNQYFVRPAIGFKPGDNLSVWAGYARFRTRGRSSGNVVNENRYWQQVSWTAGRWRGGAISMRARLLERFVDNGEDMALVLRTLVRYARPIGADGRRSLILGLEPFFDLRTTDWSGGTGIFQNRAFVGIGWRALDRLSIDTGYMNQFFWVDDGEDVSNHLLVVNFRTRF